MEREKQIIKYVVEMLKNDNVDELLFRFEVLKDILDKIPCYMGDEVIKAVCGGPTEHADV